MRLCVKVCVIVLLCVIVVGWALLVLSMAVCEAVCDCGWVGVAVHPLGGGRLQVQATKNILAYRIWNQSHAGGGCALEHDMLILVSRWWHTPVSALGKPLCSLSPFP